MLRLTCILTILATSAGAQTVFDRARGQYGSASDPANSCAANPHQLDFMALPPHALLSWSKPRFEENGLPTTGERYDILSNDDTSLTLRLEGDNRRTDTGAQAIWVLRLTTNPQGYCWGRTDWPVVRCEQQQVRCDNATS